MLSPPILCTCPASLMASSSYSSRVSSFLALGAAAGESMVKLDVSPRLEVSIFKAGVEDGAGGVSFLTGS